MSQPSDSTCAICGKPQDPKLRPFCSKRCKDLDLARWLTGGYAIPGSKEEGAVEPDFSEENPELH